MYRKRKTGWLAHLDFKILDVFVLLAVFFLTIVRCIPLELPVLLSGVIILVLFEFLFDIVTDFYNNVMYRGVLQEFALALFNMGIACGALLLYLIFVTRVQIDAETLLTFLLGSMAVDYIAKVLHKELVKKGLSFYNNKRKMILIALDDNIEQFILSVQKHSFGQVEILGVVVMGSTHYAVGDKIMGYPFVAQIHDLPDYLLKEWCDEVFMNLPATRAPRDVIEKLTEMGITTHRAIEFRMDEDNNKMVETVAGYTCLTESVRIMQSTQFLAKRAMDIVGGLIGSIFTILLTVIIGPIIFFTDPGPIFFKQKRIGKGGRVFNIIKFRSMYKDAEARKAELQKHNTVSDGMMFKMDNDPRILGSGPDGRRKGIGWFIRKFSIDEFPQFFLVLTGHMSLVGTRPPTLDEWEKYSSWHRARMAIRPGITGMWQTNGRSNITDFEEVVNLDMEYIHKMGFWFDIKLILKTVKNQFSGDGGAK